MAYWQTLKVQLSEAGGEKKEKTNLGPKFPILQLFLPGARKEGWEGGKKRWKESNLSEEQSILKILHADRLNLKSMLSEFSGFPTDKGMHVIWVNNYTESLFCTIILWEKNK